MVRTRISNLLGKITTLLIICCCSFSAHAKYGGGTGELNDPYLIFTAEQMNEIGLNEEDWGKHFNLMADIDLSGYTGTSFNTIENFTGVFDGNRHVIFNFKSNTGLFRYVSGANAEIKNLGLIDPNVVGVSYVGPLVGSVSDYGTMTNCYVEGGSVKGGRYVGGLVGSKGGTIISCYSTSTVSGYQDIGGLIGENEFGITADCYSTGSVEGNYTVGGLVGYNRSGIIINCYSAGSVSGSGNTVGGMVGYQRYEWPPFKRIYDSFWDIETSGQTTSDGGYGVTTAQMKDPNTFMKFEWDFVDKPDGPHDIWAEPAGGGYPILWWQLSPLPPLPSFSGGSGNADDPYLISTYNELNSIGHNPRLMKAHFKLVNHIDLTGVNFSIIGNQVYPYNGVFNGNDNTISNFTNTATRIGKEVGLFGYINNPNAEVKNLGLIDPNIDAKELDVGSLVGQLYYGTITSCYVEGGSVSGDSSVGGLVGHTYQSIITDCYANVEIVGSGKYSRVGGLVGSNRNGMVLNCYSTGSVEGNYTVGGLVGYNGRSKITNCYSTGSVSGIRDGGLVGSNSEGEVNNSFWDIESSGQITSAGGMGKTTVEMQMASTFFAWGICGNEGIWTIDEGIDYPRLTWEGRLGEPIKGPFQGNGDSGSPYMIYTPEELNMIGEFPCLWDKHFKLMADIDLSGFTGRSFNIIGERYYDEGWVEHTFTGIFDGNGHTISHFSYTSTGTSYIGLFGNVDDPNAEIKNLGLIAPEISAGTGLYVGSLMGELRNGTVANCYVNGGSVSGSREVGGLLGYNRNGTIHKCYYIGNVEGTKENVGGIVGRNDCSGTIIQCYSIGSVEGDSFVGGLVGYNYAKITKNCYSNVSVKGTMYVGGLVGSNYDGLIAYSYSSGCVEGNERVGGLVGYNKDKVLASFWDIEVSGQQVSAGGCAKTTQEMKDLVTFLAWGVCDNEGIWTINSGQDYPRLAWQNLPGTSIAIADRGTLYGGGNGESNNPYLIFTAEHLDMIGLVPCDWDKHFLLCADIDLSGYTGTSFNIIGTDYYNPFSGVFDGSGHTISNFTYTSTDENYIGLFGCVGGEIKDLVLLDPNVDVGMGIYVGSLAGYIYKGTITNCYVEVGRVSGNFRVGGMVGYNRSTISNCYSTASVIGNRHVGGLVGENSHYGTITICYSIGSVSGNESVGGLMGLNNYYGTITQCYSKGSVSGITDVGGLVGLNNQGTITNCDSSGIVTGTNSVGGLAGKNGHPDYQVDDAIITNCYSMTNVVGANDVGGLVGRNDGFATASFWDVDTSGQDWSDGGTGLATEQMQSVSTFTDAGWDFVGESFNGIQDIWFIPQQDYPHLWWEGMKVPMKLTPVSLNCRSEGNWVKAHITLPEGFTVADVNSNRPAVLHSFGFQSLPLYVFVNKDKLVEIETAFERQALCSLAGDWPDELTVAGFLADGNIFLGTSTVRIIHPGMKVIEELASCWLLEDCVYPETDMNRDSLVNLLDYALLMNINVEFVSNE